jgi:hypothetical protein
MGIMLAMLMLICIMCSDSNLKAFNQGGGAVLQLPHWWSWSGEGKVRWARQAHLSSLHNFVVRLK